MQAIRPGSFNRAKKTGADTEEDTLLTDPSTEDGSVDVSCTVEK